MNHEVIDELEAHLRDQIAELDAADLTADEAFLVAVKRMGDLDTLSREFAALLRGGDAPLLPGIETGLRGMAFIATAVEASRTRAGWVPLAL